MSSHRVVIVDVIDPAHGNPDIPDGADPFL